MLEVAQQIIKYFFLCRMVYWIRCSESKYIFYKFIQAVSAPVDWCDPSFYLRGKVLSICVIYMPKKKKKDDTF